MYEITQRTTDPYRAICYIVCTWSDGSRTSASGVVVGVNDVLTAMHVVYDASRGGWASQIAISPAADTKPFLVQPLGVFNDWGRLTARTADWDRDGDGLLTSAESQWDLAVIGLRTRIADVTGWVGTSSASASFSGEVVGYPSRGTGMMGERVFATASSRHGVFDVNASLGAGASGGPLLQTRSDGSISAVGVLSAGDDASSTYAALYGSGTWDWFSRTLSGNDDLIGSASAPIQVADDFAATAQTVGVVAVGGSAAGHLERPGDVDWFKVLLAAGTYRFDALGEGTGLGALGDPVVTLMSSGGTSLAQDDDSGAGLDASLVFTVSTAGVYYLAVSAPSLSPASTTGTYTVRVSSQAGGAFASGLIQGTAGNDTVASSALNERFDGGAGVDRWVLDGIRADYTVVNAASAGWTVRDRVTGRDGFDTVMATERLVFDDRVLALDLGLADAAGRAALLLGVAVGPQALQNRSLTGAIVQYFDSGATLLQGAELLVSSGIMAQLAAGADHRAFVRHVFRNVVGAWPSEPTIHELVQLLDAGVYTQASMFSALAELPLNQSNIGLVGLQQTGLEYFGA